jgi:hypothetical protein
MGATALEASCMPLHQHLFGGGWKATATTLMTSTTIISVGRSYNHV